MTSFKPIVSWGCVCVFMSGLSLYFIDVSLRKFHKRKIFTSQRQFNGIRNVRILQVNVHKNVTEKKGKHTNMSNTSFVDPFEGSKMSVYPLLGTVMTLAILLNIVNCVVMIKNKDLRKHNQFFVYITISLTEAFVDVLYMVIFFWRQGDLEYFCVFIFLLLTIGREIIQVHLLCLCVERYFALSVSLVHVFRKVTTVKGRLVILVLCIILSFVVFAPISFIHANKDVYSCGPDTLFGNHARLFFVFLEQYILCKS